jgi:type II secretory pathway component PulM
MSWTERLAPARAAWAERTVREQVLLSATVALLLIGVIAWYLILAPALSWRDEARAAHQAAAARFETMVAGVARYRAVEAAAAERPQAGGASHGGGHKRRRARSGDQPGSAFGGWPPGRLDGGRVG